MWKKADSDADRGSAPSTPAPKPGRAPATGGATIGASIVIDGEVTGSEDMTIHGKVKGTVRLPEHRLQVGPEGRIEANAFARSIIVDGHVKGDLSAENEIILRQTGEVRGNLAAPRIGLEEGAKFKGRIDMEPGKETQSHPAGHKPGVEKPAGNKPEDSRAPGSKPEDKTPDDAAASKNKATG